MLLSILGKIILTFISRGDCLDTEQNGIDFRAKNGCPCYASCYGEVIAAGPASDGGIQIKIWNRDFGIVLIYYHLKSCAVNVGDQVQYGKLIGYCDNTGKYTTGDHLHFGMKFVNENGETLNRNNGFDGAVDPSPYFVAAYNGVRIGSKDWDKSRCYHRYYRGRPKGGLWIEKYRVVPALMKRWKRLPNNEEINACTYGGWDVETVENDSMYELWSQLKKNEYLEGKRPFN